MEKVISGSPHARREFCFGSSTMITHHPDEQSDYQEEDVGFQLIVGFVKWLTSVLRPGLCNL